MFMQVPLYHSLGVCIWRGVFDLTVSIWKNKIWFFVCVCVCMCIQLIFTCHFQLRNQVRWGGMAPSWHFPLNMMHCRWRVTTHTGSGNTQTTHKYSGGLLTSNVPVFVFSARAANQQLLSSSPSPSSFCHSSCHIYHNLPHLELRICGKSYMTWISPPATAIECVRLESDAFLCPFPLRNWCLPYKPSIEQGRHWWSHPIESSGPHTAGVVQEGHAHASLVRSSFVTFTFSNLYLSNLWHYRTLPAVALSASNLHRCTEHLFSPDTERKHTS